MDLLATTGRTSIKKKSESLDATKTSSNNLALSYFIPPWPEWIDAEINAERWDANVGFPARSKEKNKAFSVNNISFEDPCGHGFLPEGIVAYNWKRITTFTFKDDLIVKPIEHDNNLTYPDLISSNHHILHNSLMRWIVCSVMNLYHLAEKDPFPVEGECPNFFPTGGRVWKPWHHVYSMCKVGKGQGHKSTVNPFGKYIVRLYFMGTWRRITVDDYIPVDQNNRILLPTCDKPYEIWPMILTKALLKIASLVWGHGNNETDFNVVICLTGWMDHVIDCTKIPIKYSWLMIQKLLMADNEDPEKRYKGFVDNKDLILGSICNSNYVNDEEDSQTEIIGKVAIFGVIHDLTEQIEILEGISPCLSHPVLISEARDLTHGYHPERPKTPRWKQYRWKAWAVKKGLVEDIHTKQQKSVSVYSVMKKFKAEGETELYHTLYTEIHKPEFEHLHKSESGLDWSGPEMQEQSNKSISLHHGLTHVTLSNTKSDQLNQTSKKGVLNREKLSLSSTTASKENPSVVTKYSLFNNVYLNRNRINTSLTDNVDSLEMVYDEKDLERHSCEQWLDIDALAPHMSFIHVYYRISSFQYIMRIPEVFIGSPIEKPGSKKSANRDSSLISFGGLPKINQKGNNFNHCFFLFIDSMYSKKVFITLSTLPPGIEEVMSKQINLSNEIETYIPIQQTHGFNAHILGEQYKWRSQTLGEVLFCIRTAGTKCKMVQLEAGVQVLRIWTNLPQHSSMHIASQTPFTIGSLEKIQDILANNSVSLVHNASEMMKLFSAVITNTHQHPNALSIRQETIDKFRLSYIPKTFISNSLKYVPEVMSCFHEAFEEGIVRVLFRKLLNSENVLNALSELQSFLLEPTFGLKIVEKLENESIRNYSENQEIREDSVTLVDFSNNINTYTEITNMDTSSFKRNNRIKSPDISDSNIEKFKTSGRKEKSKDILTIPKPNQILFEKLSDVVDILRSMGKYFPKILKYYPFRNDIEMEVNFKDYKGTSRLKDSQDWITLLRFVVNIHGNTNTLGSVHFFSSIPVCVFRVIDNDTMKDIPKYLGDIQPQKYQQNRHGYTIIAHVVTGISKYKEVNWKLRIVGEKNENLLHSCSWDESGICKPQPPQTLLIQEQRSYFIPNKKNIICRCLLSVKMKQILTLRLLLSETKARFQFRIKRLNEKVVFSEDGIGMIVIPVCQFNPDIETEQNDTFKYTYIVEVELLNNSWTLTVQEKALISNIKEKKIKDSILFKEDTEKLTVPPQNKTKTFGVGRKSVINYIQDKTPELIPGVPFWCVQVVIDSDKFSTVSLDLDQRHEEGFRSLKSTWEKEEPGRQKRSMQIRNDFIKHLEEDDTYRLFNDSKIDVSRKSNLEYLMVSYHKLDDDINNVIVLNDEIQTRLMHKHVDEVLKAHEIGETFRERLNIESKTQGKRHMLMLRHQDKCHEESKRLMLEAYTLLDNITNKMKALQEKNEFSKNKVKTSLKDKSKEKTSHQTKEK